MRGHSGRPAATDKLCDERGGAGSDPTMQVRRHLQRDEDLFLYDDGVYI
jgi:hypothetical protein